MTLPKGVGEKVAGASSGRSRKHWKERKVEREVEHTRGVGVEGGGGGGGQNIYFLFTI
jgi:hypothetical protein